MKIVFGLGNVGKQYDNTNHNTGFTVLDSVRKNLVGLKSKKLCSGQIYFGSLGGEQFLLVYPQTFMNNSGECVNSVLKKYHASVSDILVVVDDLDLPIGKIRIKPSGSAGTHNGLKSIVNFVGTSFARLRVGIGSPQENQSVIDFVLSRASTSAEYISSIAQAADAVIKFINNTSLDSLMQQYN